MKKKGKFLTFIFSMLPGAAHMYLGFMKLGVSIMAIFFALCFFSVALEFSPILFIIPVIWFYSFFDALNKNGLPDDEFYAQEDYYLFHLDQTELKDFHFGKFRLLAAGALIILGCNLLLQNFMDLLYYALPSFLYGILQELISMLPEVLFGIVIIYVGIKLILGKNTELKQEASALLEDREEEVHDENA